jgi:hypothetical protein
MKEALEASGGLRASYKRDGFVSLPVFFPSDLIDAASRGMDEVIRGNYDTGTPPRQLELSLDDDPRSLIKIAEPHRANRAIAELLAYQPFGELAAEIAQAQRVQIWAVDLLVKPSAVRKEGSGASASGNVGWHQDGHYARYWQGDIFNAWIALSELTAQAGPVAYVRGSHRHGLIDDENNNFYTTDLAAGRARLAGAIGGDWEEDQPLVSRGGLIFHHRHVLHASGPNLSGSPRKGLAVRLFTENCALTNPAEPPKAASHLDDPTASPVIYDTGRGTGSA